MKYIRSTTSKAWKVAGYYIPPSRLTESAKRAGVQPWLSIASSEYGTLSKNKIFLSLLNNREVTVSDTLPSEFVTIESVTTDNSQLKAQLAALQAENATLKRRNNNLASKVSTLKKSKQSESVEETETVEETESVEEVTTVNDEST